MAKSDVVDTIEGAPLALPEPDLGDVLCPADLEFVEDVVVGSNGKVKHVTVPTAVKLLKDELGHKEGAVRRRARGQAVLIMKTSGMTRRQIGRVLNISENAVKMILIRARRANRLNDLRDILEHDVAANAIDRVNGAILNKKSEKGVDVAVKTLEGLGHFRNYSHSKNEGAAGASMPALQVNVVFGPGQTESAPLDANVVGVARTDT